MESPMQLIDMEGELNEKGLDDFVQTNQLPGEVVVVTIIGPQSSGKSTLLNRLFGTNFREMDESKGRTQTTQGVWLAKAEEVKPCTVLMDCEGSDGVERGEDGTLFERQTALFALAVSDVLLFNMWYHDVGREKAAGRPLLRTVFKVMVHRLSPRKITLMLVVRDVSRKTLKSPEMSKGLKSDLVKSLEEIWETVEMPSNLKGASLHQFFNLKVTLLSNLEDRPLEFNEQVAKLRNDFQNSTESGGLAGDRSNSVSGTVFALHVGNLWQMVKENKDLDLPSLRVMVATVRCDQITMEKLQTLQSNEELVALKRNASVGVIEGFGRTLNALMKTCLDEYTEETEYLDENTKNRKLESFIFEIRNLLQPSLSDQIKYLQDQAFSEFKRIVDATIKSSKPVKDFLPSARQAALDSFNDGRKDAHFEWDPSMGEGEFNEASENLSKDMSAYVLGKRTAKHSELMSSSKYSLERFLPTCIGDILTEAGRSTTDTWPRIRGQLNAEVAKEVSKSEAEFRRNFDPTEEEMGAMKKTLEGHGQAIAKEKVKAGIPRLPDVLMERFRSIFMLDSNGFARQWDSEQKDIPTIVCDAKASCVRLLTTYTVVKLDEMNAEDNDGVDIDRVINLLPQPGEGRDDVLLELSGGTSWRNISERDTLITPLNFKSMWISFESEIRSPIARANEAQKAAVWAARREFLATSIALGVGGTLGAVGPVAAVGTKGVLAVLARVGAGLATAAFLRK